MYEANYIKQDDHLYKFNVKLIQVVYEKKYHYVILVNIPKNTLYETKILNVTISPLGTIGLLIGLT